MSDVSLSELLALSPADRARIAQALWDSLAELPDALPLTDQEREIIDARLDGYLRESDRVIPWQQLRERLGRNE
jgi:putative addiction module component (TIGR02574 family)